MRPTSSEPFPGMRSRKGSTTDSPFDTTPLHHTPSSSMTYFLAHEGDSGPGASPSREIGVPNLVGMEEVRGRRAERGAIGSRPMGDSGSLLDVERGVSSSVDVGMGRMVPASTIGTRTPSISRLGKVPSISDLESVFSKSPGPRSYAGSEIGRERERDMTVEQESGEAPQFIMPTISMPSRRPFTEKGKRIGKVKILIAGDSGIGKTCLIKAIVQTCQDIVHVDPLNTTSASTFSSSSSISANSSFYSPTSRSTGDPTKRITEVYASTRAYPSWWSSYDESKVLRRRRSCGDETVLERNVCFVDTPGYGSQSPEGFEGVVKYVESQMERTNAIVAGGEPELVQVVAGDGAPLVDVVLYVVLHRLKPVDIEFMRRLSPLVPVLPIIAKSDTLTEQQVRTLKLSILNDLRAAGIKPFLFGKTYEDVVHSSPDSEPCPPFAISSAIDNDIDNMDVDASILMSPDYIPPLVQSDLAHLVTQIFDPDTISWLRHLSAKSYFSHRSSLPSPTSSPSHSLIRHPTFPSSLNPASPSSSLQQSYLQARIQDHTTRESTLAQLRLARWAADLQRTLRDERLRYEELARGERAVWLTERLAEEVREGTLVAVRDVNADASAVGIGKGVRYVAREKQGAGAYKADPWGWVERWEGIEGRVVRGVAGVVVLAGAVWAWGVWEGRGK